MLSKNNALTPPVCSPPFVPPLHAMIHHGHLFLVVCFVPSLNGGHLRPILILIPIFFNYLVRLPEGWVNVPPTHSPSRATPLSGPTNRENRLLVECCILQPNSGYLKLRTRPLLYLLVHLTLAPQPRPRKLAGASAIPVVPVPGACSKLIVSYRAKSWGCGRCCQGNRGHCHWG